MIPKSGQTSKLNISALNCLGIIFCLGLCLLATVKVLFFGTDIDEQYAVTLSYRLAMGDRMFMEMWEPHQTSAFLTAFLIKVYVLCTGSISGLVIYLRLMGACIQATVSVFLFLTLRKLCNPQLAFLSAIAYYQILPKYSQTPDYSNMLLWFSTITFLCFLHFYTSERKKVGWLVGAGISTSLMILAYPTAIIAVFGTALGIVQVSRKEKRLNNLLWFGGTCMVCGVTYLACFLSHMSVAQFIYGLQQMTTDGSHSQTIMDKLLDYSKNCVELAPYVAVIVGATLVIWIVLRLMMHRAGSSFLLIMLCVTIVQQFYIWIFMGKFLKFPSIFYVVLFVYGVVEYFRQRKTEQKGAAWMRNKAAFWFGSVTAFLILLAALLASNMRIYESSEYMAIGFLSAFLYMDGLFAKKEKSYGPLLGCLVLLTVIGALSFRKGFLMYYYWGKDTVLVTKQKTLSAPMNGIYCRWDNGTDYNARAELLSRYVPQGSRVLYLGDDTILYLQGEYTICNFSTISTPSFDQRLFTYWEQYPDHKPEYIIWSKALSSMSKPKKEIREYVENSTVLLGEEEGYRFYQVQ